MCEDRKNVKNGVLRKELTSWKDFAKFVEDPKHSWGTLIYRGQAHADWKVESTLDRLEKRFPKTKNLYGSIPSFNTPLVSREIQLERFKELARGKW
ncbi:MAG TPA: hypothetical protein HPP87_09365 [Planctomycetes bacterium]|nr:hypothetical protein [Planctomycetota bacterium]HIJ71554.1 hypothetical protein [Planctomycetota bacterium]